MVVPTLLYGSETWTLQRRHRSNSGNGDEVPQESRRCNQNGQNTNEDIKRRLGVEAVLDVADRKKKEWRKKIEEMSQERLMSKIFEEEVCGRQP